MNNLTEVDDHILLPHQADWTRTPTVERLWRGEVVKGLTGDEDRSSVRRNPWKVLKYQLAPWNHVERARFDDRMRAALRIGKACAPHWGRGTKLAAAVSAAGTSLTLERTTHGLSAGNFVFIQTCVPADYDSWDVALLDAVSGVTLTLAGGLTNGYPAGTFVWPLLFGRPTAEDQNLRNSARLRCEVSLLFDQRQINAAAEDPFEDYDLGDVLTPLAGGTGWSGDWVLTEMAA